MPPVPPFLLPFLRADPAAPDWPDRDRVHIADHDAASEHSGEDPGEIVGEGVGSALAERVLAARFGRSLVDHRTWVFARLGDLDTGVAFEAMALAALLGLDRLAILYPLGPDRDGVADRARALGWSVKPIDDAALLSFALRARRPTLFIHPAGLDPSDDPARAVPLRRPWLRRLARHPRRAELERAFDGRPSEESPPDPTLEAASLVPNALTLSACVPPLPLPEIVSGAYGGRHVSAGVRATGAAAILLGAALHGGLLPIGRWPASWAARLRPLLLRAAREEARLICILEGPAPTRPDPNDHPQLWMINPGVPAELPPLIDLALRRARGPAMFARPPDAPSIDGTQSPSRAVIRGGYTLASAPRGLATICAQGAAVPIALAARQIVGTERVGVASIPCRELFEQQEAGYKAAVLGSELRVSMGMRLRPLTETDNTIICDDAITPTALAALVQRRLQR